MNTQDPWNYMYVDGHNGGIADAVAAVEPDSPAARYQAESPVNDSGTPKAPLLPFGGRPGRPCPGAPKKGRASTNFFDLSGEAPVRRLSFGSALGSQSTEEDIVSDSMDDDEMADDGDEYDEQQQQVQQQQQQPQHQQQVQQHMQHAWQLQQQAHLPSPQQLFRQQLQAVQQPLCRPLWGQMQPLQVQQPHQQQQQQQPHQPTLWNPLSPTGTRPPPVAPQGAPQGSTTPCRLFR